MEIYRRPLTHGFEIIYCEEMVVAEQVFIFRSNFYHWVHMGVLLQILYFASQIQR
jgi:hypothetical protein